MRHYRHAVIIVGLIVITVLAYFQVAGLEFVDYDDPGYITANRHVVEGLTWKGVEWAFSTTDQANWHPLTWLSLMLDSSLASGVNSSVEHIVNLVFHLGNVVLLYWILWRMTASAWPSAAVAALFAVHPIHVESVAWVSERKDVLSAFFGLAAMAAYVFYAERPSLLRYLLVFAGLTLGLLAKPMLVTLPLVFLLLDFWPLKRVAGGRWSVAGGGQQKHKPAKKPVQSLIPNPQSLDSNPLPLWLLVIEKLPLLALSVVSSVVTYYAQKAGAAMRFAESVPFDTRLANALSSYGTYLRNLFWPIDLAVMYPLFSRPHVGAAAVSLVLLLAITVCVAWWSARGKSYLAVGWLWYLGMMVPVIGLVQVGGQSMADRYMYLPAIGLYIMLVFAVADLTAAWPRREWPLGAATAVALAACIALTVRQTSFWQDSQSVYDRSLAVTADNPLARTQYAGFLLRQQKPDPAEAVKQCDLAIASAPDCIPAYLNKAAALNFAGRYDDAIEACRTALKLSPDPDGFFEAHGFLGIAYEKKGQFDEASSEFNEVLAKRPNHMIRYELALMQFEHGRTAQAIYNLDRVLETDPNNAKAKQDLDRMLNSVPDLALRHDLEALPKNPNDVDLELRIGRNFIRKAEYDRAIGFYYDVLAQRPNDIFIRTDLGYAMIEAGRINDGIRELQQVLSVKPDHDRALNTLAWIFAVTPDDRNRNGKLALQLAARAALHNRDNNPGILDTLAAACAETGQFDKAIAIAKDAIKRAQELGDQPLVNEIQSRLKLYEAHKPYHEPLPPGFVNPPKPKSSGSASQQPH